MVILGCAGSGKTTLALTMGERLALPVIHLDTLWEPCDPEAFREKLPAAVAGDAWVTEGHPDQVRDSRSLRSSRRPGALCPSAALAWPLARDPAVADRSRSNPSGFARGLARQLDWPSLKWIWTFERRVRPTAERALAAYATPVVHLNGDREIAGFLDGLMQRTRGLAGGARADQTSG